MGQGNVITGLEMSFIAPNVGDEIAMSQQAGFIGQIGLVGQ